MFHFDLGEPRLRRACARWQQFGGPTWGIILRILRFRESCIEDIEEADGYMINIDESR